MPQSRHVCVYVEAYVDVDVDGYVDVDGPHRDTAIEQRALLTYLLTYLLNYLLT